MSRDLPYSGRGSYAHLAYDAEGKAKRLSGFIEVEFDEEDESVLVHHTYAHHEEHRAVVSGFVWSRRDRL